ncbi:MAG TPA: type II toxin-antitoxin system VapC family toxin [Gemmataceae bacterium]|nr:type II toxin-antitoxin system VapC family toxin [Gemmataceae bacterium]
MYLLDTDTLTLVHAGHLRVLERRQTVPDNEIAIAIVTRIEVLQGRFDFVLKAADGNQLLHAQTLLNRTEERLQMIATFPFDASAAAEFDRLRQERKLKKIGRADLLIASIALANRATLVTRNLRHFRLVPDLQLENWAD